MSTDSTACRVLIVDDNVDLAEATSRLLRLLGFATATAHEGREAILQAGEFRPQVILLDIGLPDMSGYRVLEELRVRATDEPTTFIALSAQEPDRRLASPGFDHYFIKPVDLELLVGTLLEAQHS